MGRTKRGATTGEVEMRIHRKAVGLASVLVPGVFAATLPGQSSDWKSYTSDPAAFATQPSRLWPHATLRTPGDYFVQFGSDATPLAC